MNIVKRRNFFILIFAITLVVAIIILAMQRYSSPDNTQPQQAKVTNGNSVVGEPTQTSRTASSPSLSPAGGSAPPARPVLQKSSGNAPGSVVPNATLVEFTCEGTLDANCEVILASTSSPDQSRNLGQKMILSNDRGQFFATWNWRAEVGSWRIYAKSTNANGSAQSEAQDLDVK